MKSIFLISILFLILSCTPGHIEPPTPGARHWIATWQANTESDLAGYYLYLYSVKSVQDEIVDTFYVSVNLDTNYYEFEWPDSLGLCAMVKAYDSSGNISAPSDVVCR